MTWFGTVSALGAVAIGALFGVNAYFQFATGVGGWAYAVAALLLFVGAFRTFRKMSGGLRLLAGAWGVAAGIWMLPLASLAPSTSENLDDSVAASPLAIALLLAALAGLALTVLHKETK